jgi:hypothetical protein
VRTLVRVAGIVSIVLLFVAGGATRADAHGMYASYAQITVAQSQAQVAYLLSVEELVRHFPEAAALADSTGPGGLQPASAAISAFLAEHVRLSFDGVPVAVRPVSYRPQAGGAFLRFELGASFDRPPSVLAVAADEAFFARLGQQHLMFVGLTVEGRGQEAVLTADQPQAALSTGYRPPLAQCAEFLQLGVRHIFLGYDHLMFLLAVVITGGSLRQLVKIVTAFTVAHSVTLALAAFQIVTLPTRLVEGGIALSIAYVAFDNFFAVTTAHRWVLTFGFGLIHGFGFANVLAGMHLPRSGLLRTLLSFNAGVEVGQIVFIAALFPAMLWLARQRFRHAVVVATSLVIFLFGIGWFLQRAFDLSFMRG